MSDTHFYKSKEYQKKADKTSDEREAAKYQKKAEEYYQKYKDEIAEEEARQLHERLTKEWEAQAYGKKE